LALVRWSGLIRPPQLQHTDTDSGDERTATWLELFFDLAFVLVVAELAVGLRDDRTLHGVLVFAGLFSSVWWAWAGFTFYANRFDTDDVVYRLAKLGAMLAVAGLAASATEATGALAGQFAVCQAAIRMVLVCLYLRAYRHVVQARGLIIVYLTAGAIAAGLWLAGAMVSGPARYAAWVVAVATEVTAPVVATRRSAGLPLHLEHLPERLGLLVILVLGESIAAVAVGVQETHWERATVTVAVLGFVAAVSLWWTYFDLAGQQRPIPWSSAPATAAPCCTMSMPMGTGRSPWGWQRPGSVWKARSSKAVSRPSPSALAGCCAAGWRSPWAP
jgi:low temperature requirement protein LtrA